MSDLKQLVKNAFTRVKGEIARIGDMCQCQSDEALYMNIREKDPEYKVFEAVSLGVSGMRTHIQGGGDFSRKIRLGDVPENLMSGGKKLMKGMTPGMIAASRGAEAIRVFSNFGGKFDLARDSYNRDAGWFAAKQGLEAMTAFVECGGRFTNAQFLDNFLHSGEADQDKVQAWEHSTMMLALSHGVESGDLALQNGGFIDLDQVSRHIRTSAEGVYREEEFFDDAGTVALAHGSEEVVSLYVENGGVFLPRHAKAAVEKGSEAMILFSAHGGKYPEDGSLSPLVVESGVEAIWAYHDGEGVFNDESKALAERIGGETLDNFNEAMDQEIVRNWGHLEL